MTISTESIKTGVPDGGWWSKYIFGDRTAVSPECLTHSGLRDPVPPKGQISRSCAGYTQLTNAANRKIYVESLEVSVLENGMMISGSGGGIWVEY